MAALFRLILLVLLVYGAGTRTGLAQEKSLKGKVTTVAGGPLLGAHITLLSPDSTTILRFTGSSVSGNYRLDVPAASSQNSSLLVRVQLLGYRPVISSLTERLLHPDVILQEEVIKLKDVVVKGQSPRIKSHGDTTTYNVQQFARGQDRTIGDVLKRIPGISVEDNGAIRFNGKSVTKLYLDGDDLLDDKYNIGTRTIPQQLVNDIQVLENHQRIKVLEGKVFSEDVDINLKFKKMAKVKLFGQVAGGGGIPRLYDADMNAIALKNSYKSINLVKANNSGRLLSDDILSLNEQQTRLNKGFVPESPQLSAGTLSAPSLEKQRYTFNQSALASSANLWSASNGMQIKSKAYYLFERQNQSYQNLTSLFVPRDTLNYQEALDNRIGSEQAYIDLAVQDNQSRRYLNNALVIRLDQDGGDPLLLSNGVPFRQRYKARSWDISNEFSLIRSPSNKRVHEYYANINYRTAPESLRIDSIAFPSLFGTPDKLSEVRQQVNIPTFYANTNTTARFFAKAFTHYYKAGFAAKLQRFESGLSGKLPDSSELRPDAAENNLLWNAFRLYAEPGTEWRLGAFRWSAKLATALQVIQPSATDAGPYRRILFNPSIAVRYDAQQAVSSSLVFNRSQNVGSILLAYPFPVLNNYRTLSQNNDLIGINDRQSLGGMLSYKDPVQALFINFSGNIIWNQTNNISYNKIARNLTITEKIPFDNRYRSLSYQAGVSKFVFPLGLTADAGYQYQFALSNQFVNNEILPFQTRVHTWSGTLKGNIGSRVSYRYDLARTAYVSQSAGPVSSLPSFDRLQLSHKLALEIDPATGLFFKITAINERNSGTAGLKASITFIDVMARYHVKKPNADLELDLANLRGQDLYQSLNVTATAQYNSRYPLRGRQALLKVFVNF